MNEITARLEDFKFPLKKYVSKKDAINFLDLVYKCDREITELKEAILESEKKELYQITDNLIAEKEITELKQAVRRLINDVCDCCECPYNLHDLIENDYEDFPVIKRVMQEGES